jgi:hypothetical protein
MSLNQKPGFFLVGFAQVVPDFNCFRSTRGKIVGESYAYTVAALAAEIG